MIISRAISLLCTLILGCGVSFAQSAEDEMLVSGFFTINSDKTSLSPGDWMIEAARYFLNKPYVASTLEVNKEEQLVVNLRELDCTTLIENCLALTRTSFLPNPDYELFCRELKRVRYRDGVIDGYSSRLHYISDWTVDNMRKGILEDVTYALGGKKLPVQVSYMSTHPDSYPSLKDNPEQIAAIRKVEETINSRNVYYYIPKREIREKQSRIKNGDIICFTTSIKGLDVSHLGIAYWQKGELTFIHASSKAKKVIVNPESLFDFCMIQPSTTGIMVVRPNSDSY